MPIPKMREAITRESAIAIIILLFCVVENGIFIPGLLLNKYQVIIILKQNENYNYVGEKKSIGPSGSVLAGGRRTG